MRSAELSNTPATTRKRARNQTGTGGLLSQLAVPKLKAGEATPPHPSVDPVPLGTANGGNHMQTEQHRFLPASPLKAAAGSACVGKENRPVTFNNQPSTQHLTPCPLPGKGSTPVAGVSKRTVPTAGRASNTPKKSVKAQKPLPAPVSTHDPSTVYQYITTKDTPGRSASQYFTAAAEVTVEASVPALSTAEQGPRILAGPTKINQAVLAQDVPLACHTAINKRRRPGGQATRYGEWYTGNDTDLDEQLLEYNAEQAQAASAAGTVLDRRKSDLASYAADKDDTDFSEEVADLRAGKRSSRLRRSTIAPGQDTAAQVAAMTAELSRLADDMLPQEEEERGREGRRCKQDSQQNKDLRQRLLDSWDGKTYYERLQAEAEDQQEKQASSSSARGSEEGTGSAGAQPGVGAPNGSLSHPFEMSSNSKALLCKAPSGTPNAGKTRPNRAPSPSKVWAVMSPELLGSSEATVRESENQQQDAAYAKPTPAKHTSDRLSTKESGVLGAGPAPKQAAALKRLPPLPPAARGMAQASSCHAAKQTSSVSRRQHQQQTHEQQQHKGKRFDQAHEPQASIVTDRPLSDKRLKAQPADSQKQQPVSLAGSRPQSLAAVRFQQAPEVKASAAAVAQSQKQTNLATSKGRCASNAAIGPVASNVTEGRHAASAENAGAPSAQGENMQSSVSDRGGQQQVARLTASNTALLAELVDLQAAKAVLEEQLTIEREARQAAEASNKSLSQQLADEQLALASARKQVHAGQSAMSAVPAGPVKAKHAGSSRKPQTAATLEEGLIAVKHHATSLTEAVAALEGVKL